MLDGILSCIESHRALTIGLVGLSFATFVASLLILPFLVSRLPVDYFSDPRRHRNRLRQEHPLVYFMLRGFKNLLGWALLLSGILMLVLPGQGLLTIIIGLILSDFPGKFALERRLASTPKILGAINWMRRRRGLLPLLAPWPDE